MSTLGISLECGMFLPKKKNSSMRKHLIETPPFTTGWHTLSKVDNVDEEHKKECRDRAEWLMINIWQPQLHVVSFLFLIYFNFLCTTALPECLFMYQVHAWSPWRPKEDIRPPELELKMALNCHLLELLGSKPRASIRSTSALHHWAIFPVLEFVFFHWVGPSSWFTHEFSEHFLTSSPSPLPSSGNH